MIKHIVFFKIKETLSDEKPNIAQEIKHRLDALPKSISEIKALEVGVDFTQSPRSFDLSLITAFETVEALNAYRVHPEHVKVVEYIKTVAESTIAVDYEV